MSSEANERLLDWTQETMKDEYHRDLVTLSVSECDIFGSICNYLIFKFSASDPDVHSLWNTVSQVVVQWYVMHNGLGPWQRGLTRHLLDQALVSPWLVTGMAWVLWLIGMSTAIWPPASLDLLHVTSPKKGVGRQKAPSRQGQGSPHDHDTVLAQSPY